MKRNSLKHLIILKFTLEATDECALRLSASVRASHSYKHKHQTWDTTWTKASFEEGRWRKQNIHYPQHVLYAIIIKFIFITSKYFPVTLQHSDLKLSQLNEFPSCHILMPLVVCYLLDRLCLWLYPGISEKNRFLMTKNPILYSRFFLDDNMGLNKCINSKNYHTS